MLRFESSIFRSAVRSACFVVVGTLALSGCGGSTSTQPAVLATDPNDEIQSKANEAFLKAHPPTSDGGANAGDKQMENFMKKKK